MKKLLLLALLTAFISSCGNSKRVTKSNINNSEKIIKKSITGKLDNIIDYAKTFEGTRYKYGGTTKKGMDCSGLIFTAFNKENIALPRISREMAKKGRKVSLSQVSEGDLVFFQTNKNRRVINHVGLVVETNRGEVFFIHSTTSRGVIVSSLDERYWKSAFVEVRRVI